MKTSQEAKDIADLITTLFGGFLKLQDKPFYENTLKQIEKENIKNKEPLREDGSSKYDITINGKLIKYNRRNNV
jgi:hypothetical protein